MSKENPYTAPLASDEPVLEIDSLELLWEQHKGKIIGGAVAVVVIVAAVFGWMIVAHSQRVAAETAYGAAKTEADYRALIEKYPSSLLAGNASLLLADLLRGEKKYDEANQVLDQFVKRQPEHPFAPLAKVAAAMNSALAGKTDEAESQLESVALTDSKSFAAPFAMLMEAELKTAQRKREEALKTYNELVQTFPSSIATRAAGPAMQSLESLLPPAPTPAPKAP